MEYTEFVRKPFIIEAVEITTENIEELAQFIGTIRHKEDGTPYIDVDRRLIPNINVVWPGFWMTRIGSNTRCYSKKIFMNQFATLTPQLRELVTYINSEIEDEESDDEVVSQVT